MLKLSKEDFNAGFGDYADERGAGRDAEAEDRALRSRLLSFIQMVSRKQRLSLAEGEPVFREGALAAHPPCAGCPGEGGGAEGTAHPCPAASHSSMAKVSDHLGVTSA